MLRVGGLIQRFKEHRSKKGDRMAFTVLEDMTASVEVVVFLDTFARCGHLLGSEEPLIVQGSVQVSERGANIIADDILPLAQAMEKFASKAVITLPAAKATWPLLNELKTLLYQFHGTVPVKLTLHFDGRGEADIESHHDLKSGPARSSASAAKLRSAGAASVCRCSGQRRRSGKAKGALKNIL